MSWQLVVIGVVVHLVLIYSIFDIYYTSPIIKGANSYDIARTDAPAKRLIIISADGLRLDTFTQNPDLSPFLHSIIRERKGVSGVSRSHVPTESRPGHVAIFAGFTEDVSAVARGWKKNPVPFDSIFNKSRESWLWGSPDIVDLFADISHVNRLTYSEEEEDFASNNAYKLDEWVFERVESFLNEPNLEVEGERTVLFLHLLGLDTNGHGNKPHSQAYLDNLKVVDSGIARLAAHVAQRFPDGRTSWVFTSDHGMTDWGSHGAGSDEEVLTPFVAWGAGVQKGGARRTLSQIDLAPLMSSLIGAPVPVNSVGVLPIQLLDVPQQYLFRAAFANFQQLKEQVLVLRNEKARRLWFSDYDQFGDKALRSLEEKMTKLAKTGRFTAAASLFVEQAGKLREAIFYYHRYDRGVLGASISLSFIAWIALVWCYLVSENGKSLVSASVLIPGLLFRVIWGTVFGMCYFCGLPFSSYIYILLPCILFSMIENHSQVSLSVMTWSRNMTKNYATSSFEFLLQPFLSILGLIVFLFVLLIVFMDRRFLVLIFLGLFFAPAMYPNVPVVVEWVPTWRACCVAILPFPFFATVGRFELPFLCVFVPLLMMYLTRRIMSKCLQERRMVLNIVYGMVAVIIALSGCLPFYERPPSWIRLVSWMSVPAAFVVPLFSPAVLVDRLAVSFVSLMVPYCLLSIAYESLFMIILMPLLLLFVRFEFCHLNDQGLERLDTRPPATIHSLTGRVHAVEVRRAIMCLCFVMGGLFGTGNFASLNSFNPSTLGRFISVFSPFTMATLLVLKAALPLLMTSLAVAASLRFDGVAIRRLSCLVLIVTDLMAMCFFHQLKDTGSWLDIGLSISQYIVSMCMSVAVLLLLMGSSKLMTINILALNLPRRTKDDLSL